MGYRSLCSVAPEPKEKGQQTSEGLKLLERRSVADHRGCSGSGLGRP